MDTCEAGNITDALATASSLHPDLITTNTDFTDGSGLSFIQQIRASAALRNTPIVVISGNASSAEREQAEQLGPTTTTLIPFTPQSILAAIALVFPHDRLKAHQPTTREDGQE
jgi:CheY-like chemotaxis protein